MHPKIKTLLQYAILLAAIPAILYIGTALFGDRQYAFATMAVAILGCVPFFMAFERGKSSGRLLIIIAVMVAASTVGRLAFIMIPHFKPVTALVIITALYFGPQSGFATGALTAVISNFYFGQGPWTPFQMFAWGLTGLLAGLLAPILRSRPGFRVIPLILLAIYGAFAGVLYSLLMDAWSTLWWDGYFNLSRYVANIITSLPVMASYAISNAVFLLILAVPLGAVLDRLKTKYGIGE